VARFDVGETNVEQLVAALTGAYTNEPVPAASANPGSAGEESTR
jgi:hypothetical protein